MIVINTEQLLPRPPFRAVRAHEAITPDPISLSRADDVWIDGLSILSPVCGLASAGVFKQLTNSVLVVRVETTIVLQGCETVTSFGSLSQTAMRLLRRLQDIAVSTCSHLV